MISKIIPKYFFGALFIGLMIGYMTTPEPTVIIKYPTPFNVGRITYKDDAGVCYKYKMEKQICPNDKSKITNVDIQQSN